MKMVAMPVLMMPITSWELMAGTPSPKGIRKKTKYIPMGGNNINRASSILKPRRNISTCMMMTRKVM